MTETAAATGSRLPSSGRWTLRRMAPGLSLFIVFFALYHHHLVRLYPLTRDNDTVFYADTADMRQVLSLDRITFKDDMRKHLLFSVVTNPPVRLLQGLFHLSTAGAITLVLATVGALNPVAMYSVLRVLTARGDAFVFALSHGFLFSNLFMFSIVETYAVSNLVMLLALNALGRFQSRFTLSRLLIASTLAGLAGLFNPVLLSLAIPGVYLAWRGGRVRPAFWLPWAGLLPAAVTFFGAYRLIQGPSVFRRLWGYASYRSSPWNFAQPDVVANVVASFFFYSVLAPVGRLSRTIGVDAFAGYFTSAGKTAALLAYCAVLWGWKEYLATTRDAFAEGLLLAVLPMLAFYIYFDPGEAMLFSSQFTVPITLLSALALQHVRRRYGRGRHLVVLLGIAWLIALITYNLRPFYARLN